MSIITDYILIYYIFNNLKDNFSTGIGIDIDDTGLENIGIGSKIK